MINNEEQSFLKTLSNRKIFINLGSYDFRCGIDTLIATSTAINCEEFYKGALFAFCSSGHNQIRIVFWEGCGGWMITRKVNESRFKWPDKFSEERAVLACYKDLISLLADPISQYELSRREVVERLSK
jgi:hypothetical protein